MDHGTSPRRGKPRAAERNAAMIELRRQGWTLEQIGELYGVSRQRVEQILKRDAPEVQDAARIERVARSEALHRCIDCGEWRQSGYLVDRCKRCYVLSQTIWTQEAVVAAIQDYADQYGEPPTAHEWNPALARQLGRPDLGERFYQDGCWPHTHTVQQRFGSWNAAIAAAGFTPRPTGHRRWPGRST